MIEAPWCRVTGRVIGPDAAPHGVGGQVIFDPDPERVFAEVVEGEAPAIVATVSVDQSYTVRATGDVTLHVNGKTHSVDVSRADMPLLWVLRDVLNLTGTKYGCGIEVCGACTVMMDGQPEHACVLDVSSAAGKQIVTIEGLSSDALGQKIQASFVEHGAVQCGFCTPGFIMSALGYMGEHPNPT